MDQLADWPPAAAQSLPVAELYDTLADTGLRYGPTFQGLRAAWRAGTDIYAEVELPAGTDTAGFQVHPALLDAALHGIGLGEFVPTEESLRAYLPFSWSGVRVESGNTGRLRVRLAPAGPSAVAVRAYDEQNTLVLSVESLSLRPMAELAAVEPGSEHLYRLDWLPAPVAVPQVANYSLVIDEGSIGDGSAAQHSENGIEQALRTAGSTVQRVAELTAAPAGADVLLSWRPAHRPARRAGRDPGSHRRLAGRAAALAGLRQPRRDPAGAADPRGGGGQPARATRPGGQRELGPGPGRPGRTP